MGSVGMWLRRFFSKSLARRHDDAYGAGDVVTMPQMNAKLLPRGFHAFARRPGSMNRTLNFLPPCRYHWLQQLVHHSARWYSSRITARRRMGGQRVTALDENSPKHCCPSARLRQEHAARTRLMHDALLRHRAGNKRRLSEPWAMTPAVA